MMAYQLTEYSHMKVILTANTIAILANHLDGINEMITDSGGEPLTLSSDRVESVVNNMIAFVGDDCNIFEEYDEATPITAT